MRFRVFSKKQRQVLSWWCNKSPDKDLDAIICDGAVRSGKTLCMSLSFVLWACARFHKADFALCSKSVASLRRNVVRPLIEVLNSIGYHCKERLSQNELIVAYPGGENRFYLFGGNDESSAARIQGITLSGVLLDEVALMPRSFVEQTIARCSVTGSKFWFNCNPEHPQHWFYTEWILKAKEKKTLYLHFLMDDNPSLSQEIRKRYQKLYSGAFYERFVLGKWVCASGLVYPMFGENNLYKNHKKYEKYYISCDYGTVNPTSMGLWGYYDGCWYRVKEFYHDSRAHEYRKTDEEYYRHLEELAGNLNIESVIVDPSASSFMECIRRHGKFVVKPAKNDVLSGIRRVSDELKSGRMLIHEDCVNIRREFSLYAWDNTAMGQDNPKKEYDHAMDEMRYFINSVVYAEKTEDFFVMSSARKTATQKGERYEFF